VRLINSEIDSPHNTRNSASYIGHISFSIGSSRKTRSSTACTVFALTSIFIILALRDKFMQSSSISKSFVFWDITQCSPLKVSGRFGGTCRRHLQCRRISQARNQREAGGKLCSVLSKHWLAFNGYPRR
jgi:hypothetical protein